MTARNAAIAGLVAANIILAFVAGVALGLVLAGGP